jgi:alpha-tubulin suppressor-like RCC1 family protein
MRSFGVGLLSLILVVPACIDVLGIDGDGEERTLYIRHTALILAPGDAVRLTAYIDPQRGMRYEVPGDRWWSEDETVVRAAPEGMVEGLAPGRTTIWVEAEGERASAAVAVRDPDDPPSYHWRSVVVGDSHACALDEVGQAYCWGMDAEGQLGHGKRGWITATLAPSPVVGDHTFETITAGGMVTCGLESGGDAWCWGFFNQTGSGIEYDDRIRDDHARATPERVDFPARVAEISTSFVHSCLLDEAGAAYCWGDNEVGQLGLGHFRIENPLVPNPVATERRFSRIQPFSLATCGVAVEGAAYSWGNKQGREGGRPEDEPMYGEPRPVSGEHRFSSLADAGIFGRPCGIDEAGRTYCWSALGYSLDHPDEDLVREPAPLSEDPGFEELFTGGPPGANKVHCGLRADGSALCWGSNTPEGILGAETVSDICGTSPCNLDPTPVAGDHRFRNLSIGTKSACGVTVEGALYCWGDNRDFQLGLGRPDIESSPLPTRVPDPL